MSSQTKVVITGIGATCPIGTGFAEICEGIRTGFSGLAELSIIEADHFPTRLAAEARAHGKIIRSTKGTDRKSLFLRMACDQIDQQWNASHHAPAQRALCLGTGIDHFDLPAHVEDSGTQIDKWMRHNFHAFKAARDYVEKQEFKGAFSVNVSACVASTQAMGQALRLIRKGLATCAITGGYDSMLSHLHYLGFFKLGALSSWSGDPGRACRPFSRDRQGIVLGEGAAVFALENADYANPANIIAELAGYGSSTDAFLVTDPDPSGHSLAKAASAAILDANLTTADIDCVHLHGTGTFKNDLAETAALRLVFGERYTEIPVFSLKGQIGHLIGACGALETLAVLYSMQYNEVPITINSEIPDPDISLNIARTAPIKRPIRNVLKLNAAFGGQNTALVFRKPSEDASR